MIIGNLENCENSHTVRLYEHYANGAAFKYLEVPLFANAHNTTHCCLLYQIPIQKKRCHLSAYYVIKDVRNVFQHIQMMPSNETNRSLYVVLIFQWRNNHFKILSFQYFYLLKEGMCVP